MTLKANILAVEDQEFNQIMLMSLLEDEYDISCVNDGLECIESVKQKKPDLILMDVKMSNMDGLETCRRLRINYDNTDLPVLFVSGMTSDEDRLEGYKAGGDDYITKPYNEDELLSKIKVTLENSIHSRQMKDSVKKAQKMAMDSLTNSFEIGNILSFVKSSFNCNDFASLQQDLFDSLNNFALDCSVLFKQQDKITIYSSNNIIGPLEEVALTKVNESDKRIIESGQKAFFNAPLATLLVRKMPVDNIELTGRLKDHLAILIEALDSRIKAINNEIIQGNKKEALAHTIELTRKNLQEIEDEQRQQQITISSIISNIGIQMEQLVFQLGLNDEQEQAIETVIAEAEAKGDELFNKGTSLETRFEIIIAALKYS